MEKIADMSQEILPAFVNEPTEKISLYILQLILNRYQ